jgi:hypothetical protein
MGRARSINGEKRNAYRIVVGKPEGKTPLGRPRRRWVDNIKIDVREIEWDGMDWIDLAPQYKRHTCYSSTAWSWTVEYVTGTIIVCIVQGLS